MTDAELAKAVADACGMEVDMVYIGGKLAFCEYPEGGGFDPAFNWNQAMLAAEKCGLFSKHHAAYSISVDGTHRVSLYCKGHRCAAYGESGPRAICEAILAVTKGEKA